MAINRVNIQSNRHLWPRVGTAILLRPPPQHPTSPAPLNARRKKMTPTLPKPLQTLVSIGYNNPVNQNIATRVGCVSPLPQTGKRSIPEQWDENTGVPSGRGVKSTIHPPRLTFHRTACNLLPSLYIDGLFRHTSGLPLPEKRSGSLAISNEGAL